MKIKISDAGLGLVDGCAMLQTKDAPDTVGRLREDPWRVDAASSGGGKG